MKKHLALALVSIAALAGCNQPDVDTSYLEDHTPPPAPATEGPAVRLEQAERAIEVGRDVAGAKKTLQGIVADASAPADVRDRAAISLSRACEATKDKEGAIQAVEALLAAHDDDHDWPGHDAAERRLRALLTGKEEGPSTLRRPEEKVAPIAKAFAAYFPTKKDQPVEVAVLAFGGDSDRSEALGTFRIGDALREIADDKCPLCDNKMNVRSSMSRTGSWTQIPATKGRIAKSLAVFYTHLGDPIPARYDDVLPVAMSEVLAHLTKGEGVVVAKERPNAPPAILIAAPREAQLAEVEEALAMMKALPGSLTVVKVTPNLKPDEIRSTMRGAGMPAMKKCYEGLLSRAPAAAGRTEIAFTIKGDGTADDVKVEASDTLREGTFERCMSDAVSALRFAATGQTTTVKYPVTFSP